MPLTAAELLVRVSADTGSAERDLNSFGDKVGGMARKAGAAGAALTAGVTAPIVGLAVKALSSAADFEQSMNMLQAATDAPAATMTKLQEQALQLGAETSFSAGEAAEAMLELGRAGLSTAQIGESIAGVMDLAAAGGIGLAEAANLTTAALNAFHLEADQSGRIADLLAAGANESNASMADLGAGLQQAGFAAAAMGVPIEDTVAAIAMLTNVGLTGSDAGTALKNAFTRLMSPTKEARTLMRSMGISVFDAQGNFIGMEQTIANLNIGLKSMSQEERLSALNTIFLSDGMKAMMPLLDAGTKGFAEFRDGISEGGEASAAAEARTKGLRGAIEYLMGSIDSLMIGEGTPFLDTINGWVRGFADFLSSLTSLDPAIQKAILIFAGIAAAIGPVLLAVSALATAIGFIGWPLLLIGVGIGVLAAAWYTNFGGMRDYTAAAWAAIQPKLLAWKDWLITTLPAAFAKAKEAAQAAWDTIKDLFSGKMTFPELVQKVKIEWVVPALPTIKDAIMKIPIADTGPVGMGKNIVDAFLAVPWADYGASVAAATKTGIDGIDWKAKGDTVGLGVLAALAGVQSLWDSMTQWVNINKATQLAGLSLEARDEATTWRDEIWAVNTAAMIDSAAQAAGAFMDGVNTRFETMPEPVWLKEIRSWWAFATARTVAVPEDITHPKLETPPPWIADLKAWWATAAAAPMAWVIELQTWWASVQAGTVEWVLALGNWLVLVGSTIPVWVGTLTGWVDTVSSMTVGWVTTLKDAIADLLGTPEWVTTAQGFINKLFASPPGWVSTLRDAINRVFGTPSWISSLNGIVDRLLGWAPRSPSGGDGGGGGGGGFGSGGEDFFQLPYGASGFRNFAGGLAMVGERGPEIVSLPRGANVYSASDTRGMLAGAGGVNIVINAHGYSPVNAEALALRVARIIGRKS